MPSPSRAHGQQATVPQHEHLQIQASQIGLRHMGDSSKRSAAHQLHIL